MTDASLPLDLGQPNELSLGELIEALAALPPTLVMPLGFAHPHSYRGYYEQLAFETRRDVTVGSMLDAARSALGSVYQGWKGGDYLMHEGTPVNLVSEEGSCGEPIGSVSLGLMIGNALRRGEHREVAATPATPSVSLPFELPDTYDHSRIVVSAGEVLPTVQWRSSDGDADEFFTPGEADQLADALRAAAAKVRGVSA